MRLKKGLNSQPPEKVKIRGYQRQRLPSRDFPDRRAPFGLQSASHQKLPVIPPSSKLEQHRALVFNSPLLVYTFSLDSMAPPAMVTKYFAGLRALLARRFVSLLAAALVLASLIVVLIRVGPPAHLNDLKLPDVKLPDIDMSKLPSIPGFSGSSEPVHYEHCDVNNITEPLKQWKEARKRYDKLMDDKFT